MLECHELTIYVHHFRSVEGKLLLERALMGQYAWKVLSSESALEQSTCNWGWSSGARKTPCEALAVWTLGEDDHSWATVTIPELDLGATALCFGSEIETRRWLTEPACDLYSLLRLSSKLWNVLHRELRAVWVEKEYEIARGSGMQSMNSGNLGRSQVFRDFSPQGTNSIPVPDPFLIIL